MCLGCVPVRVSIGRCTFDLAQYIDIQGHYEEVPGMRPRSGFHRSMHIWPCPIHWHPGTPQGGAIYLLLLLQHVSAALQEWQPCLSRSRSRTRDKPFLKDLFAPKIKSMYDSNTHIIWYIFLTRRSKTTNSSLQSFAAYSANLFPGKSLPPLDSSVDFACAESIATCWPLPRVSIKKKSWEQLVLRKKGQK